MTIDTFEISESQVNQILQIHEGHFSDLKRKEIKPAKLTQTLSAFANADGGEVYVGVGELEKGESLKERFWDGFKTPEDANGHLQTIQEFFPFEQYINVSFLGSIKLNGFVLHIQVHKSKEILTASDGSPYVRRGAQNIPVKSHEDLKKLEFDKGTVSYEQQVLNLPVEMLTESEVIKTFISQVIPSSTPDAWLRKQLLIQSNKPTVAGILLFADEPQAALPKQSGIKIFRYKTRDKEGSRQTLAFDPMTIEGNIYDQIKKAVNFTVKTVEDIKILGEKGFENISYPEEAVHEIVTNAVLHRDYSKTSDVQIIIFDNRIEILSPGKLPGHITTQNILEEQLARNGALVRLINKFPDPPNKDVGEGLNTAFHAMRKLRLKEPEIEETVSGLKVTIYHEPLASPEEIVMKYLDSNEEISNSIARELCGIDSENEMKRVFQKLQAANLLERTPSKKGSASTWRKPQNEQDISGEQMSLF
ncbi:ATP-dependent DNA helicase RecG [Cyclobacterium xiamenense]|uniref:ATP-dependent DNA helicase RecG n=1 Tax=Cyclobacterium xiamenense TaxID=1297121 RepID=A0A1H7AYU0_9BACT|nr:ATP-binding protein [Cyclobacterium xiamenense]SEJ67312.1 ATP-dependent DNA helicase RecG [Cyclobacterium xiamenense]